MLESLGEFFELGALFRGRVAEQFLGAVLHALGGFELLSRVPRSFVEFAECFGEPARAGGGLIGPRGIRARRRGRALTGGLLTRLAGLRLRLGGRGLG